MKSPLRRLPRLQERNNPMDVKAHLRFLRMSPRKVRLVIDTIRGKSVSDAVTRLKFLRRDASLPVLKLLQSAMANAENNFNLEASKLRVKSITADGGPVLKRFRPRAHGSAGAIRKRTSHITIILSDEAAIPSKRSAKKAMLASKIAKTKKPAKQPLKTKSQPQPANS
jgi:large subunit ribosomal protein L22